MPGPAMDEAEPTETRPHPFGARSGISLTSAKPLRLGVVWAAREIELPAVAGALHDVLGRSVSVLRFRTYAELVDAVLEHDLELGWLPPVAYVRARRARDVRLLFTTVRATGPSYHSALLGRAASSTTSSRREVGVPPGSMAGARRATSSRARCCGPRV